jgi:Lrp/AsnC family leucine-responsive transcriptional regulator
MAAAARQGPRCSAGSQNILKNSLMTVIYAAMDDVDRKIIQLLQSDGDRPLAALGRAVGLSVSAVNERIKKLKSSGALVAIQARANPQALGLDILAFVHVLMDKPAGEGEFIRRMREMPEVLECHHITGDYSYLLKLRARDPAHLEQIIPRRIKSIAGVARTHSVIALSTAKETLALDCRVPSDA